MKVEKLKELIGYDETEIVEFKENWFNKEELGEYISALSNSATYHHEEFAYFIWGITNDEPHEIVGTDFKFDKDYSGEPLKHY